MMQMLQMLQPTTSPRQDFLPYLAVDLLDGNVVRLSQGKYDQATVYHSDPAKLVAELAAQKIRAFHLVDLNRARDPVDSAANRKSIQKITSVLADADANNKCSVQIGGGLRTLKDLEDVFSLGVDRAILGTAAFTPLLQQAVQTFTAKSIAVALDVKDNQVKVHGWRQSEKIEVQKAILHIRAAHANQVIFTDIHRDGMLTGPGQLAEQTMKKSKLDYFVSGGVSCLEDVQHIQKQTSANGVIIGRAYYENKISLAEIHSCHV